MPRSVAQTRFEPLIEKPNARHWLDKYNFQIPQTKHGYHG
jgi:hypothetical protein